MNIYNKIENAIRNHHGKCDVPAGTSQDDVYKAVRNVMRDNPDIFCFSHQWKYVGNEHTVYFRYTIQDDRSEKIKKSISKVVDKDFRIGEVAQLTPMKQVMYVYKWLALYCRYNVYAAYHQTICSVFVYRNSVCTGIAKAAQYLLGIESQLVFGKMNGSKDGSRHCWLIVNVEGIWYHLAPTFAIPSIQYMLVEAGVIPLVGDNGLVYNYFCTDTETIKLSRSIEEEESLPICEQKVAYKQYEKLPVKVFRGEGNDTVGCLVSDKGSFSDVFLLPSPKGEQRVIKAYKTEWGKALYNYEKAMAKRLEGCPHILRFDRGDYTQTR